MTPFTLEDFVRESNRIEGIPRVRTVEIDAHTALLSRQRVTIADLAEFVSIVQLGAVLRDREGLNVRVGRHVAPEGGAQLKWILGKLLADTRPTPPIIDPFTTESAYETHLAYEHLHPFTDGNGRSGRALWLWMMGGIKNAPLGFLHTWYYQNLNASHA